MSSNYKWLFDKFDFYIAIFTAFFSLVLLIFYTYAIGFSIRVITSIAALLIASVVYLFVRDVKTTEVQPYATKTYKLLLNVAFIVLFIISCVLLFKDLYVRPLSYFILISIMSVLIFLETDVSNSTLVLPKIVMIAANLRIGLLYKFPSVFGVDPPYHLGFLKDILATGDAVGAGGWYSEYPIPHIMLAINQLIMGIGYKDALTFAIAIPLCIISIIFVYLIGKELFNERIGMIATLLLVLFPFHIWLGYVLVPMSLAIAFFPMVIYLFIIRKPMHTLLGVIVLVALMLSHPLVMAMLLVTSFGLFCGSLVYKINHKDVHVFPFLLILIILLFRWMYFFNNPMFGRFVNTMLSVFSKTLSTFDEKSLIISSAYVAGGTTNLLPEILNALGVAMFIALGMIGLFHLLKAKKSLQKSELIFGELTLLVIVLGSMGIALYSLIPHRWMSVLAIFLAIPAAIGIKKISVKKSISIAVVFLLAFSLITNSVANMDSPIYAQENTVRYAFTASEMSAAKKMYEVVNTKIIIDRSYAGCFRSFPFEYTAPPPSNSSTPTEGVFLVRNYIFDHAFYTPTEARGGRTISVLNETEKEGIEKLGEDSNKIYDNGEVRGIFIYDVANVSKYGVVELNL